MKMELEKKQGKESIEEREKSFKGTLFASEGYYSYWAYKISKEYLNLYKKEKFEKEEINITEIIINEIQKKIKFSSADILKYLKIAEQMQFLTPSRQLSQIDVEKELELTYEKLFNLSGKKSPLKFILVAPMTDSFNLPTPDEKVKWDILLSHAAKYFIHVVKNDEKVGFSGGRMPLGFVKTISDTIIKESVQKYENLHIQALAGEVDPDHINISANSVVSMFANLQPERIKARGLNTFPIFSPKKDLEDYKITVESNRWIEDSIKAAKDVKFAFTGIGTVKDKNFALTSLAKIFQEYRIIDRQTDLDKILEAEIVGDILYIPFNKDGNKSEGEVIKIIMDRIIGLNYDDIKKMAADKEKRVMAITGGLKKKDAIHAAIKGELINSLIIDEPTARMLVNDCNNEIIGRAKDK